MYHKGDKFRSCSKCGVKFELDPKNPKRRRCPSCIAKSDIETDHAEVKMTGARLRARKRCELNEEQKRRERQRLRDYAWARWERENGFAPRFEYHGDKLVEIRGRIG